MFRKALVSSIPVLLGYTTMGFAAGVLLGVTPGVPCAPLWSGLIALMSVSGTFSFIVPGHIAAGGSLLSLALLTFAINFRYAFYGFSMLKRWKGVPRLKKYLLVHSLADEIFALDLTCHEDDPLKNQRYCLWNHALCTLYWVMGTTLGALAGANLPIPSKGIEFTMVALFLVIFTDQMRDFIKK